MILPLLLLLPEVKSRVCGGNQASKRISEQASEQCMKKKQSLKEKAVAAYACVFFLKEKDKKEKKKKQTFQTPASPRDEQLFFASHVYVGILRLRCF